MIPESRHFRWKWSARETRMLAYLFILLSGAVDQVQAEWHNYVRRLKSALATNDVYFLKTGTFRQTAAAQQQR